MGKHNKPVETLLSPIRHTSKDYRGISVAPFRHMQVLFIRNEQTFLALSKKFGFPPDVVWQPGTGAACTTVVYKPQKIEPNISVLFLVRITQDIDGNTWMPGVAGIIAHEATHVVDLAFEEVGEDKPGQETRAYMTQTLVEDIMEAIQFWYPGLRAANYRP